MKASARNIGAMLILGCVIGSLTIEFRDSPVRDRPLTDIRRMTVVKSEPLGASDIRGRRSGEYRESRVHPGVVAASLGLFSLLALYAFPYHATEPARRSAAGEL